LDQLARHAGVFGEPFCWLLENAHLLSDPAVFRTSRLGSRIIRPRPFISVTRDHLSLNPPGLLRPWLPKGAARKMIAFPSGQLNTEQVVIYQGDLRMRRTERSTRREHGRAVVLAVLFCTLSFGFLEANAQQAASFEQLQLLVRPGDRVTVTESTGRTTRSAGSELSRYYRERWMI